MPRSQPELVSEEDSDNYEQRRASESSSASVSSKARLVIKSNKNEGRQTKGRRTSNDTSEDSSREGTPPRLSPTSVKREWTCSKCQSPNDQRNSICYICEKGHRPKQNQKQGRRDRLPRRRDHSSNERRSRSRSYSRSPCVADSQRLPSDRSDNESHSSKSKGQYHYETRQQARTTASSRQYSKEQSADRDYSDDDSRDRHHSTTPNRKQQHESGSKKEKKDSSREKTSLQSPHQQDKQDWTCSKCHFDNDYRDKDCYRCGKARFINTDRRNDWKTQSSSRRRDSQDKKEYQRRSYSRCSSETGSQHSPSDRSDNESYTSKPKDHHRYETRQQDRSTASSRQYSKERSANPDYSDDDNRDRHHSTTSNRKEQHESGSKKEKKDSSRENASLRSPHQQDKQDWTCSKCHFDNDYRDKECYRCGKARPINTDRRNDWKTQSSSRRRDSQDKKEYQRRSYSRSPSATDSQRSPSDRSDNESYASKPKGHHRYETRQQARSTASSRQYRKDAHTALHYPDDDHGDDCNLSTRRKKPQDRLGFNEVNTGPAESFDVYITKLPIENMDDKELEEKIQYCLRERHREKILSTKCNQELGVGIVSLKSKSQKERFINILQSVLLGGKAHHEIKFVAEVQLTSYVVINSKSPNDFTDYVRQGWEQAYKNIDVIKCEKHCVQFPNIFRIVSTVSKEMITSMPNRTFTTNGGHTATVYFGGECRFFEDLPLNTTSDSFEKAVIRLIPVGSVPNSSFYIEYNSEVASAVVVTCGRARQFASIHSIEFNGKTVNQKAMITCRLILKPWSEGWHTSSIKNHTTFSGKVEHVTIGAGYTIVEISDESLFHQLSKLSTIEINGETITMTVYKPAENPEHLEINALNWYETEMSEYENDIMVFVSNPQHRIFRFKWSPESFLEQFRLYDDKNKNNNLSEISPSECNKKRHLLRMTVMLNTIGVVNRGFYYVAEKQIKLKTDQLKTVVYNHQSKLQTGMTKPWLDAIATPYKETSVEVVNEDCLLCYQRLIKKSEKMNEDKLCPVVLNMANADSPGGGYRKGDGAQEENMFRRSNYSRSLDMDLDFGKPTPRFYCNSQCKEVPISQNQKMYSMDEFGAIYTSGLNLFRDPENEGYAFMSEPMYDVCAIAMAADPRAKVNTNNRFVPEDSLALRKKIENIFSIAYHHKHDCLVLSALGCGAFKNPPKHVSLIFKSVIEQFAGFFKCIHFAIRDDHNAGRRHNPDGNYQPFREILHDMRVKPSTYKMEDMMVGPRRILKGIPGKQLMLSDIRICYLQPCHHGGNCRDIRNDHHCKKYSHPPLCPLTDVAKCPVNDEDHLLWFRHRSECKFRGECKLLLTDEIHAQEFEHPPYCQDRELCKNMKGDHLKEFRHLPLCEDGEQCKEYKIGTSNHCQKYRHCTLMCDSLHFCSRFHNENHMIDRNHPFLPPCPFTPFHCQHYTLLSESTNIKSLPVNVQNHCLQFSHVCRFGRRCHQTVDVHWKTTIHVARQLCYEGDRCSKKNQEDHLNSFTHPEMNDIRRLCKYRDNECRDRHDPKHIMQYRHNQCFDCSGAIRSWGLNDRVDFVQNQITMYTTVADYVRKHFGHTLSIPPEILAWIRGLQAVHRCSNAIFESILVHGHVMSRDHMERLTRSRSVVDSVLQHKRIRSIFDRIRNPDIERIAKEYIQAIVSLEYDKADTTHPESDDLTSMRPREAKKTKSHEDYNDIISSKERQLRNLIEKDVTDVRKCSIGMAKASLNLMKNLTGIGYHVDKLLGTDKHIFSILGPHRGFHYGDIVIIFKAELMRHPDANFSIQAGTSVHSGSTFKYRPWIKDTGTDDGRIKQFDESKLHCSIPGYEDAAAAELMVIAGVKDDTIDVNLKKVLEYWNHVESHKIFEGHLPTLVPLDYIEEVYMPKNVFESLSTEAKESAKKIFRDSLKITDHTVDLGNVKLNEGGRKKYNKHIVETLIDKFEKNAKCSRQLHATFITVPPSEFGEHILLPLTISKAYEQYQMEHRKRPPSDDVYIYWKSMDGDVMITLSDQLIGRKDISERIRCLVCYVAKTPLTTTPAYHESYSYLNCGQPDQHFIVKHNLQFAKGSNTFHRGCNVDDFLTYCLRIQMNNGQVTLSHAGPNSIYNCQTISHTFSKRDLNMTKLNYIYVSAGSEKVPIRNFTICFSKVSDLHPSVDNNFKRENRTTVNKERSISPARSQPEPTTEPVTATKPETSSKLGRFANWVGSKFKGKKLEPCPDSINCLQQNESDHIEKFSHPCRFSELCNKQDNEPHLTHFPRNVPECTSKNSCSKLDDPVHRAQYRHIGKPAFLIPCNEQKKCQNTSYEHRVKYSHGEHIEITFTEQPGKSDDNDRHKEQDEKIACRHGLNCCDKNDANHCSKFSHFDEYGASSFDNIGQHKIECRHGTACRDQNDPGHCSKYSHPHEHRASSSNNMGRHKIECRHGTACRDKNYPGHCSKYSHPDERKYGAMGHSRRIICKHGMACRDIDDADHCSKYSHPNE